MSRIIRINSCADCPYGEMTYREKPTKYRQVNEHFRIVTETKMLHYYNCGEIDEPCQEGEDGYQGIIPDWCPLEKE